MDDEDYSRVSALVSITAVRLAEVKATQEVILKGIATIAATMSGHPWEPLFEDLRNQAKEATAVYQQQVLNEFQILAENQERRRKEREGPQEGS